MDTTGTLELGPSSQALGADLPHATQESVRIARMNGASHTGASDDLRDVESCRNGNTEAYRRIVERYQQRIARMMWRFARDPGTHEDLVQEVFIEAFQSLPTFRARAPFEHWLARIATHVGYRHWRMQARRAEIETVPLEDWHELTASDPEEMDAEKVAELLYGLIAQLPARDRLVMTLRYIEDRSVEETSRLTGWSVSMVKVQAWRARRKLEKLLEKACGGL
jgi:RNA polymerase sigma-70 factor (ECF subfamily)